ncbi:MAG: phosphodiester glycosidase family protein [Oscillospiraceae bacterium]|jgi:hypothetical protein|nr:phosphodiester glycosidase family protein [Oscillospiraceae bacterium]
MRKRFIAAVTAAVLIISLVCAASAVGIGNVRYTATAELSDNLTYTNTVAWREDIGREETYELRLNPSGAARAIAMGDSTVYEAVDIADVISQATALGYNVLGAINADFFSIQTGVPLGLLIEDGRYKSGGDTPANAVAFLPDGTARFLKTPQITMTIQTPNGDVAVPQLNKMRYNGGDPYLFTSEFSEVSTRTTGEGWFVRLKILGGELTARGEVTLEVVETFTGDGAVPVGDGFMVLTASGAPNDTYNRFIVGQTVTLRTDTDSDALAAAQSAVGCGDFIVEGGEVVGEDMWEAALKARSPKTAIGVTANGEIVALAVDGRNTTYANGVTLRELADEMIARGCVTAVNLDGGGSTAISVRILGDDAPTIRNRPSDGTPRRCASYILFVGETPRGGNGAASYLTLRQGAIVLAGSVLELTPVATDAAGLPAAIPSDVRYRSSRGTIDGAVYTAGTEHGVDRVEVYSPSGGASGYGEVFVVANPTSIYLNDAGGAAVKTITVDAGGRLQLTPTCSYYRLSVTSQPTAFTYEVEDDIGTVSPDGLFTAGNGGDGRIVIRAGTASYTVSVTVTKPLFEDCVNHWAVGYIEKLAALGVVRGVTDTTFAPDKSMLRRDFLLMLYRAVGEPEIPELANPFTDIPAGAYYQKAASWAYIAGIAQGVGDNRLDPDGVLTREQAFTFLYRALGQFGVHYYDAPPDLTAQFSDSADVSEYAKIPTATLVALGVVGGSDGKITPKNELTRAQMAKMLCVIIEY